MKNRYARMLCVFVSAIAITLTAVIVPAVPAVAGVTPAQGALSSTPPGPVPVLTNYSQDPAAVQAWETNAEQQVAALRGVPDDLRNQLWSRGEITAYMYAQLMHMATESNPSSADSSVVNWFAGQLTANQEAVATRAQDFYNQWQGNPCGFEVPVAPGYVLTLPSGYQDSYVTSVSNFCEIVQADPASCIISGACTPSPPSSGQFTAWAAEYIQQQNIVTWGNELLYPPNTTLSIPAGQPTTVAQAQGQALKEYDGSYNDFGQGISFLDASRSALATNPSPTAAQSDFSGVWDEANTFLAEHSQNQLGETVLDLLSKPFDTTGDEASWIDDIVEGVLRVAATIPSANEHYDATHPDPASSNVPYRIYNIGNHHPVKLMDFIETIERTLGVTAHKNFLPFQDGDVQATNADVSELIRAIGELPHGDLATGIEKFVAWYKSYHGVVHP